MKLLLAISSWYISALNADHQSSRDTWMKNSAGIDCRFFMGDGSPVLISNEDENLINNSWNERQNHYNDKPYESHKIDYIPKEDEILLPVPYDFKHLSFKVREIFRWALERDYDYIFKVDTDTYVDVPRLLTSGFQNSDYIGTPFWKGDQPFASGGAGYWISKKAYSLLVNEPITIPWDDIWVGDNLRKHNINLTGDTRYNVNMPHNFLNGPRPNNSAITGHLGFSPEPFNNKDMWEAHRLRWS